MFVLQFASGALLSFFASTVCGASVGLYAATFDPPTRSEERIIRCALGDTTLSRQCQDIGKEISRVLVLVNEDDEYDTLASTRERVLMVKKALRDYGNRVEVLASTPAQMSERVRALLTDQNIEQLFHIIGPAPFLGLHSIPAGYDNKIVRVRFPLEQGGSASQATKSTHGRVPSGAKEVIAKLGLYQSLSKDLADLQKSLFEEGWRDFLDDLISACPDTMNKEICGALASKWRSISIITDDQATKMDQSENLLVYKQSQSEDRWAEKFAKTATKFLEGTDSYLKFRAVAADIAARTFQGYPYGRLPHLRRAFVQNTVPSVQSLKVTKKTVACSSPNGPYEMDMDQYLADRFPRALARFLSGEFRHSSSMPIDLYVHNHSIDEAYEFHRRDQFATFYFLQTRRSQLHRHIYLAVRSEPRAYRLVFTSVRGNDRQANVLCQIHRASLFADYRFVQSNKAQPLFVLNSQGQSLRLSQNDLLLFGFKGNWSRMLAALNWKQTPLVNEGLDIDLFTHPTNERKLVIARNVYGDDTDIILDTFYKKGVRQVIYLGSAGAVADYQIGDVVIPNEFVSRNSDSVPFPDNSAHDFQPELARLLTIHGQQKHGWVPTVFEETKDLLLDWRAKSIGAVDIEGWYLGRFARRHPDIKMGVFFVLSDQTLGVSTINESNAHRGVIDASANKLISFLIRKLLGPQALMFDTAEKAITIKDSRLCPAISPALTRLESSRPLRFTCGNP
jgi:uridine phosphorylase